MSMDVPMLRPTLILLILLWATYCGRTSSGQSSSKRTDDYSERNASVELLLGLLYMNRNTCSSSPYVAATVGQSYGPYSQTSVCFHASTSAPLTIHMFTNGTAAGLLTVWNPLSQSSGLRDDPTFYVPSASSDLWVFAFCQDPACSPWNVQF